MPSTRAGEFSGAGRPRPKSRRAFLGLLAIGSAGLASCAARPPTLTTPAATPPPSLPPPPRVEAGRVIAVDDLYVKTYRQPPTAASLDTWTWTVGGQVRQPQTLTWAALQSMPLVEQMHTLECIGNPVGGHLLGNLVWQGVRLRDLLALANPAPDGDHLLMSGADEYFTCVPLDLALDERSLLAFRVGGQPLPRVHGYPARVLLPGVYGQKQPKWLTALEVVTGAHPGTWERQGWSDSAVVQVNARIDYPEDGAWVPAGQPLPISGVALADTAGVSGVEVSVDGGARWASADIFPGPSPLAWTTWEWRWQRPDPGSHAIKVRATSGSGQTQVDHGGYLADVFPNGTASIHTVTVTVT